MKTFFLGFVGYSGVGKTTLIEQLINLFSNNDDRIVGAIKHDAHNFEIDYPGKDSYRMKHAGAKRVVLSSGSKLALIENVDVEKPLNDIKPLFHDCDIVLIEGYKIDDIPKIEVHRGSINANYLVRTGIENIILEVTDEPNLYFGVPTRHIDDVLGIYEFIKHYEHVFRMR